MAAPTLVLLAAGMGSRFGGPKQIAPIGPGGSALIDYAARDAVAAGFGRLVLIVRGEIIEAVERHVAAHRPADIRPEESHRAERPHGSFVRSFSLPQSVDQSAIRATQKNGVLEIILPKRQETKASSIRVEVK